MIDLKALRALCDAATQGDWRFVENKDQPFYTIETEGERVWHHKCVISNNNCINDGHFIAATDPQTVRALIDEIEQRQAAIRELRSSLDGCLGHMTGGMDGTWSEEFDPIHGARQTLENTKKWSEE